MQDEIRNIDGDLPLLSLAMIVRNGGQFLAPLLSAAAQWVDEIVVGDTGSRDDSRQVAVRAGARLLEVPWTDDFAAARNTVQAACRGQWLLSLDADEQLAPTDWARLCDWTADQVRLGRSAAGSLTTRNYLPAGNTRRSWRAVPADDPHALPDGPVAPGFVPTAKVRLFPNSRRIRFQGRLHETVEGSLAEAGIPVVDLPFIVHHFGMLTEDPAKTRRYLDLARRKSLEQPHQSWVWSELADSAAACSQWPEALAAAERGLVLDPAEPGLLLSAGSLLARAGRSERAATLLAAAAAGPRANPTQRAEAFHGLARLELERGDPRQALVQLARAVGHDPSNGHLRNTLGVTLLACGEGEAARRALETAVRLLPDHADPRLNLGLMYEAVGRFDAAMTHLQKAAALDPTNPRTRQALIRITATTGRARRAEA